MAGPEPDNSIVLAIACATRNPGIAIGLAAANFPAEQFGATIILYAFINWQNRTQRRHHADESRVRGSA